MNDPVSKSHHMTRISQTDVAFFYLLGGTGAKMNRWAPVKLPPPALRGFRSHCVTSTRELTLYTVSILLYVLRLRRQPVVCLI